MADSIRSQKLRSGSALVEFTLSSLVWLPLLLGTFAVGLSLTRSIETTQICRDAGHMYAYGVDFSQPNNQQILLTAGSDFHLALTGGNGVVILSTILMVGPTDCLLAPSTSCANLNQPVFLNRLVIGNSQLRSSAFGTPNASEMDSSGNITPTKYLNDAGTRALSFTSLLPLAPSQRAYVAETYFAFPDLDLPGITSAAGSYSQSIF